MIVLSVTTAIPAKFGFVYWCVEFPQDTIEEVSAQLEKAGCIHATRYDGEYGTGRALHVRRKVPVIIGVAGIVTITPLHIPVIDGASEAQLEPGLHVASA